MARPNPAETFINQIANKLKIDIGLGITEVEDSQYKGKVLFDRFIASLQLPDDQWLALLYITGDALSHYACFEPVVEDTSEPHQQVGS